MVLAMPSPSFEEQQEMLAQVVYSDKTRRKLASLLGGKSWLVDECVQDTWKKMLGMLESRRQMEPSVDGQNVPVGPALNDQGLPMATKDFQNLAPTFRGYSKSDSDRRIGRERKKYSSLEDLKPGDKRVMVEDQYEFCLLYTSPSPRDRQKSRMPSSA